MNKRALQKALNDALFSIPGDTAQAEFERDCRDLMSVTIISAHVSNEAIGAEFRRIAQRLEDVERQKYSELFRIHENDFVRYFPNLDVDKKLSMKEYIHRVIEILEILVPNLEKKA